MQNSDEISHLFGYIQNNAKDFAGITQMLGNLKFQVEDGCLHIWHDVTLQQAQNTIMVQIELQNHIKQWIEDYADSIQEFNFTRIEPSNKQDYNPIMSAINHNDAQKRPGF